jgi:hypothetical protein
VPGSRFSSLYAGMTTESHGEAAINAYVPLHGQRQTCSHLSLPRRSVQRLVAPSLDNTARAKNLWAAVSEECICATEPVIWSGHPSRKSLAAREAERALDTAAMSLRYRSGRTGAHPDRTGARASREADLELWSHCDSALTFSRVRYLKGSVSLKFRDREFLHLVADSRYITQSAF